MKRYIMINKLDGARIETNEKYILQWLGLGFEVEKIILPTSVSRT